MPNNPQAALLDSLMGPERNADLGESTKNKMEFSDPQVISKQHRRMQNFSLNAYNIFNLSIIKFDFLKIPIFLDRERLFM